MAGRQKNAAPPPATAGENDKDDVTADDASIIIEDEGGAEVTSAGGGTGGTGTTAVGGGGGANGHDIEEDEGVRSLREQKEAAERRAADAEAQLQRERTERGKDQVAIRDSRLAVIDGAITTSETKRDAIKKRIQEAKEAGDYAAETEALGELAEVTLDLKQAKIGKERLEREIEEREAEPAAPSTNAERIRTWGKNNNMGERSINWLVDHEEYMTDRVKNAKLTLAEQAARDAGHAPNTDAYFKVIEEELGLREKAQPERREEPRREPQKDGGIVPAAPVSRSAQPMGARSASAIEGITDLGNGKYRVSKEIAEAAAISGIPVKQYVEEALKLTRGNDGQLH